MIDIKNNMKKKKQNILKIYSRTLLKICPEIKNERVICKIEDIFNDIVDYNDIRYKHITSRLNLNLKLRITDTTFTCKDSRVEDIALWQCNDAVVISNKNKNKFLFNNNQVILSEKKSLYYPNKVPKYNLIIFGSTYNEDFTGGIFEFSDGTKIEPCKNMCIFFNSKEAHYIHRIYSGIKKATLITFY